MSSVVSARGLARAAVTTARRRATRFARAGRDALNGTPLHARHLWDTGDQDQAIEHARVALAQGNASSAGWFQYGMWLLKAKRPEAALEAFKFAYDLDPCNARSLELLLDFPQLSLAAREHCLETLLSALKGSGRTLRHDLAVQFFALHGFLPGLRHQRHDRDPIVRALAASALETLGEGSSAASWLALAPAQRRRAEILRALSLAQCSDAARLLTEADSDDAPSAMALRLCLRRAGHLAGVADAGRIELALAYLRVWPNDTYVQSQVDRVAQSGQYDPLHTDDLTAYQHFERTGQLPRLPQTTLRHLYRVLSACGYLEQAHRALSLISERSALPNDVALLQRRGRDLTVHCGQWQPPAPITPLTPPDPVPDRVLHVVGKSLPKTQSGYTLRTNYIVRSQRALGVDPYVFCQPGEGTEVIEGTWLTAQGIPHYFYPSAAARDTATRMDDQVQQLRAVAQQVRPAILHAHSDFLNGWVAHIVGTELNIPVVYESRGFWEESWMSRTLMRLAVDSPSYFTARLGMPTAYSLRAERERWVRARADVVVTLAEVMRTRIVDAGLDASQVHLVPNAVDTDQFPVARTGVDRREHLNIPADAIVIGYISSLMEYEGIDTLIRAASEVQGTKDVHLLVVGDGPERGRLEALAREVGGHNVHFTGRVPHSETTAYYATIDIFVVPRRDTRVCHLVTPLKPFEALASGCCVVLSDVGALQEIAADSGGVIPTFRSDDVAHLSEVLQELIDDDIRRRRISAAGAQWVRRERSWAAVTQRYLPIYRALGWRDGTSSASSPQRVNR